MVFCFFLTWGQFHEPTVFLITWLVTSAKDTPNTRINPFGSQHRVLSQKRGDCGLNLWPITYRVLWLYLCIRPHIWSLFQQHWWYLVMAVYFYLLLIYILYVWYHSLEKKDMRKTVDGKSRIFMVDISARRLEPLHRSVLQ